MEAKLSHIYRNPGCSGLAIHYSLVIQSNSVCSCISLLQIQFNQENRNIISKPTDLSTRKVLIQASIPAANKFST